ncbi:hypothetical protein AXG93_1478s1010 [Marchantia polymorpha subsp. ruderalis]|uniref:peptidyl-tRNA hydrolase n=1 Tax=Marchantia polymorpha subsp. ruderalis TaxID=1480154 RepID=A0A176VKS0_MARPO|nr:hypothetical protein AXG93_1478s1010 [Marchantia polymorpha subsp. ruderalis]
MLPSPWVDNISRSLGEMQQGLRNFAPSLFAGVRINGPEIKALLQHIRLPSFLYKDTQCLTLQDFSARNGEAWLAAALGLANFVPGFVMGFLIGVLVELPKGGKSEPADASSKKRLTGGGGRRGLRGNTGTFRPSHSASTAAEEESGELKMVFVVRQDLKMGAGKIASQCARKLFIYHKTDEAIDALETRRGGRVGKIDLATLPDAAVGTYEECLNRGQRLLLRKWEDCGQPKIVVTCKSQHEMNELRAKAERAGLPCFTVADAGRTQVAAGSKTVLAIGPGAKTTIDNVTRHLRLL